MAAPHSSGKILLYLGLGFATLFSLVILFSAVFLGKYLVAIVAAIIIFLIWKYPRYSRWILGPLSALMFAASVMRALPLFGGPDWIRLIYFCACALLMLFCVYVFLISYPVKRYLDSLKEK